jgi:hypothetical protein
VAYQGVGGVNITFFSVDLRFGVFFPLFVHQFSLYSNVRVLQFTLLQNVRHFPRIVFPHSVRSHLDRLDSVALGSLAIPYCSIQVSHSHEKPHAHMTVSTESISALSLSLLHQLLDQILPLLIATFLRLQCLTLSGTLLVRSISLIRMNAAHTRI